MTFQGALQHCLTLATGSEAQRKFISYMIGMRVRGFDLSGVSSEALGYHHSHFYANSGGPDLEAVLDTLLIAGDDACLDIGCGKGGAMITMARYAFRQVDGIEISPDLVEVARRNLSKAGVPNAAVFCCDAAEFKAYDPYTMVYMFNPVPEGVMQKVMVNLQASLNRHDRRLTIIYKNPLFEHLILAAGFQKTSELDLGFQTSRLPFHIYTHGG